MSLKKKVTKWIVSIFEKGEPIYRHPLQVAIKASCELGLRDKYDEILKILTKQYSGPLEPDSLFDKYVENPENYKKMRNKIKDLITQDLSVDEINSDFAASVHLDPDPMGAES